ncbi:MAG: C-GCAxxG-C-C family (seleno)protein [Desulfobulbaceae bacterium]
MHETKSPEVNKGRRKLLAGAGKAMVGAAIISAGAGLITRAGATNTPQQTPWGYVALDPQKTADLAYENWYKNYCCYAVTAAILDQLREKVGGAYVHLPAEAFIWGHGGAVGWGTLCGTLTGAGIVTSFAAGKEGEEILNDVIAWYGATELPIYKPAAPKATFKNTNISDSPLCHISVGKWMKKEGVSLKSAERRDRCARVAADVAFYTVTLLNQWADGKFEMKNKQQSAEYGITAQDNCMECHGDNVPEPKRT